MSKMKVSENDFSDIVSYYNENGKSATYCFLRKTYNLKNPRYILTRIERSKRYRYDSVSDRYELVEQASETSLFMSIDELCLSASAEKESVANVTSARSTAMEKLVQELIGDRLLELTRYITMNSAGKTIAVDQTSMKADGYTVILH